MEIRFNSDELIELGKQIESKIVEWGLEKDKQTLELIIPKEIFKKLDEDLYYRQNADKKEEYVPSDNKLMLSFDYLNINVKSEEN